MASSENEHSTIHDESHPETEQEVQEEEQEENNDDEANESNNEQEEGHEQEISHEQEEEEEAEEVSGQSRNDQEEQSEEEEEKDQNQDEEHDSSIRNESKEDENENNPTANDARSDDEEFAGFGEEEIKNTEKQAKKRQIVSDDSDEKENEDVADEDNDESETINRKKKKKHKKNLHGKKNKSSNFNDEGEQDADMAGEESTDDEEVGDKEVNDDELESIQSNQQAGKAASVGSQENSVDNEEKSTTSGKKKNGEMTDLEKVLTAQRMQNKKKNRRKNVDSEELNEMDNKISAIITEMKSVASDDRSSNEKSLTAIGKLKMLPTVVHMLQKSDYHATMIELGILSAIAEWLAPLPDRSLSNIKIREELIDALRDFGEINADYLKSSGIGKAVMFLYKHPKETKANKHKLERLINSWSRPIFNLDSNFKQLSREERLARDMEHVKSLNRRNSNESTQNQNIDELISQTDKSRRNRLRDDGDKNGVEDSKKVLRPGDPGFCPRARVPIPSSKDYINRPKSNVENMELNEKKVKKPESRLSKHKKRFIEIQKNSKCSRAITMSVNK